MKPLARSLRPDDDNLIVIIWVCLLKSKHSKENKESYTQRHYRTIVPFLPSGRPHRNEYLCIDQTYSSYLILRPNSPS